MFIKFKNYFHSFLSHKEFNKILLIKKIIKPILFLKYIVLIFTISFFTYLIIPKFLNHENKVSYLKKKFEENFNINLREYGDVKYKILPSPHLVFNNVRISIQDQLISNSIRSLKIKLKISEIYKIKKTNFKKILIEDAVLLIQINKFKNFLVYINNLQNIISIKNSSIIFKNADDNIIKFKNIKFDNYDGNNNNLTGSILGKKFILKFVKKADNKKLILNIPEIGFNTNISFYNIVNLEEFESTAKIQILNNKILLNIKKKEKFKISNSYFRNSLFKSKFNGQIQFSPFLYFDLVFNSNFINLKDFTKYILKNNKKTFSKLNKKINGKILIKFSEKNTNSHFINEVYAPLVFKNGEMIFNKSYFLFDEGKLDLNGSFVSRQGYEKINFNIVLKINDKNKLFKKIKLQYSKKKKKTSVVKIDGNLNLSSNTINFHKIVVNENIQLTEKELVNIKENFENIIINKNLLNIFNATLIREFINTVL